MTYMLNTFKFLFSQRRFDEEVGKVELDYPRDMSDVWRGVGYDIDTVFQWKDGKK